jgi:hypothetical protein
MTDRFTGTRIATGPPMTSKRSSATGVLPTAAHEPMGAVDRHAVTGHGDAHAKAAAATHEADARRFAAETGNRIEALLRAHHALVHELD